jgi:predicted nucleotidyltransferase
LWYCDQWQMELQAVPNTLATPHDPRKKLQEIQQMPDERLSTAAKNARDLAQLLQSKVPVPSEIGITGSILVGLENAESDYDLVIYGRDNCKSIYSSMDSLFASDKGLIRYTDADMPARYKWRAEGSGVSLEKFSVHDLRKTHQGRFHNMDFFLRYVQYPEEAGGNFATTRFSKVGKARVTGTVEDASLALFTPCTYRVTISSVEGNNTAPVNKQLITEIVSFRGRFCEQLITGESFRGQGILERVDTLDGSHIRILLGNQPTDYLIKI